jgi:2,6-dihydroxypyridine 3-monooxygenase
MRPLRISIAGGSIGGLTTAVLLHEQGHDVHVYERSTAALKARGAGIVVLPMTERYFVEKGLALGAADDEEPDVALTLTNWSYINEAGDIIDEAATYNRFTSWNTLYRALLDSFPTERYHLASHVTGTTPSDSGVTVRVAGQPDHSCDLLVGADGISSTVRDFVAPDTPIEYSGYVAWRGTVLESDLSADAMQVFDDALVYQILDHSHILAYAIPGPGDSIVPGERALNWVWYRNASPDEYDELMTDRSGIARPLTMPPGLLQDRFIDELRSEANRVLAPQLAEVITKCADTFIQSIFDMTAARFVRDRVLIQGDAASAIRPHVAAGAAKACADAWALRNQLAAHDDLDAALEQWEASQLTLARTVVAKSAAMGRASQVDGVMVPGDANWRFGLSGPGA